MRTTITIDDTLYEQALQMAGPNIEKAELIREAMKTYVRVGAANRLSALGGKSPDMQDAPRLRGATQICDCILSVLGFGMASSVENYFNSNLTAIVRLLSALVLD